MMSSTKEAVVKGVGWRWRQYLAAILVNFASLSTGFGYGWTAPILPLLQSEDSPVGIPPLTDTEASWIASIATLSRLVSIPAYMYTHDRLGRKITSYLTAIPYIVSCTLLLSANSVTLLLCGRIAFGVGTAGTCLLVPSYISDVAEDDIRGRLGILYILIVDVGIALSYAMGHYLSYVAYNTCCLLLPIFLVASMFWLPESPVFLLIEGKQEEAKMALRWLRNGRDSDYEMDRLRARAEDTLKKRQEKLTVSDITERSTMRGILINLSLTLIRYLTGVNALLTYTVVIFQEAGSTIEPYVATIVVGSLLTVGELFSSLVVERCGRRPLLICSTILLSLSLVVLGTYFYLKYLGWDLEYVGWMPLVCLCLYNMLYGVALGPLPSTLVNEMVTVHARGAVQALCNVFGALLSFAILMTYLPMTNTIGQHGCFWFYAGSCFVGAVSMFLTVPETKNRSIEDVIQQLKGDHYIRSVIRNTGGSSRSTKETAEVTARV